MGIISLVIRNISAFCLAVLVAGYNKKMNWRTASLFLCVLPAVLSVTGSLADIRDTPHNFTRTEQGKRAGDREVCAFCHTPVIAIGEGTKPAEPPAWQPSVGTELVFTIYDDIGRLGLGKASVGSQSVACLSCHDSNQAMGANTTAGDHPFGIPYRGVLKAKPGVAGSKGPSSNDLPSINAKGWVADDDFRGASSGTVEGRSVWWVSHSGITARRGKNDLPLYVRSEAGMETEGLPYIECSSCHDPHSANKTFLRTEDNSGGLCMTCHAK